MDNKIRIHISVAFDSEKHNIIKELFSLFGKSIVIIDTITFYEKRIAIDDSLEKSYEIKKEELSTFSYIKRAFNWFKLHIETICNLTHKYDVIIFVGLLDDILYHEIYYEWEFSHIFYLDIPNEIILKEYYSKILNSGDKYWKQVANSEEYIESSIAVLKSSKKCKKEHLKMNYTPMSKLEIIEEIKKILSNNDIKVLDINDKH